MAPADIGLIGLAVMGKNLVLNMIDHGFAVSVYNRSPEKTEEFLKEHGENISLQGFTAIEEFVQSLKRPRKIMIMIKAGAPVDEMISSLLPFLEEGDILIDGGNSYYLDSERRYIDLKKKGILFVGMGVSGGEEGARKGPSIMPGGNIEAWPVIAPIFQSIAAQVDGQPCCSWIGTGGAGHFVKAVHNGIEYGDIQLICETYEILKSRLDLSLEQIGNIFFEWNQTDLNSYLMGASAAVLTAKDENGVAVASTILDVAGQKGTGRWVAEDAIKAGVPMSLIIESVLARYLSAWKEVRRQAAREFPVASLLYQPSQEASVLIEDAREALYAAKIISYAQGFMLLKQISEERNWDLNLGELALIWRGGCIIQSAFLDKIHQGFESCPDAHSLMLQDYFKNVLLNSETGFRRAILHAVGAGVAIPCLASALAFYDGYRTENSPLFLVQGLRDYFGAHGYERQDRPRGEFYHTDWLGSKNASRM
ncbi:phosphogluconate dehydrogenase (NADP(+)-dependent, decarboxylating) [Chlamydia muridarum str. Nigg]|uniref:6-phosphogluconate dehydrogenase, decarboxylating n=2 Tax=Chlamydia muridarum TaxID=83560 RepID=6PGD_CHLMU|nr:decarboxylating NADP(+)-dependent phosphogluconate dehydrogenase [Chlamydia muridarum]Q9PKX7.1 RecName: Full=6-phosphogluconate dehydrogenase, decarboxylating [Chlamydia muridarum str. Nigg]AAF39196.1 6-phosphogluconate dehydrogenase, decarboxylating [Chlamydia muridarum str. Nigg]AHH22723.1 6-phosphogluconate dehydrogenase [Chlamydia muridarum str. Nigg3 CMUT3-5]AHH23648.1 6-phosphogluconate dehydrogenase [Chlamydia muridarum str. Nigg CM972]AID37865.1 6-phosphogluconate dehydrogenase [Chl